MNLEISLDKSAKPLQQLKAALPGAKKHFSQRIPVDREAIGASGSMFRVFRGIAKPSVVYKEWAYETVRSKSFENDVSSLQTQRQFDVLHKKMRQSLAKYWKRKTDQDLAIPYQYKLLDVFIKRACELGFSDDKMNSSLLEFGHVPLDSLVFKALDEVFDGIFLLQGRSMGHVKSDRPYEFYQQLIRELMSEFDSPPLYFEYYAWNLGRNSQ